MTDTTTATPTAIEPTAAHPVADLHRNWILHWDRAPGDPPFVFERDLADLYDFDSDDVILYDDFDPDDRVARSAGEYGTFWDGPFNGIRSARHSVVDGPAVVADGTFAASRMVFIAALELGDGTRIGVRATTSSVWRLTDRWRIVREHTSTVRIPIEDAERLVGRAA